MKPVFNRAYFGSDEGIRIFGTDIVLKKSKLNEKDWEDLNKIVDEIDLKRQMIEEITKDYARLLKEQYGSEE